MFIETTKDLFWLLFGISVVLFTLFVCWSLFYMIMMLKDMREVVKSMKRRLDLLEEFLVTVKEKITDTSQYLKTIIDTAVKVTGWFVSRKDELGIKDEKTEKKRK